MRPAPRPTTIERAVASRLTRALFLVILVGAPSHPQATRASVAAVSVRVTLDGRAEVQGRYTFRGNPGAMSFEWLERPCASVGPVRLESLGAAVPYARVVTGPWVRLHDTSAVDPSRDSLGYAFSYEVLLRGRDVAIPILLPTAVLTPRRGTPIARLSVTLPAGGRITLPGVRQLSDSTWGAMLIAMPSAVHVRLAAPNESCEPAAVRESGRFVLIFWALVATLALWVPLYMWWANREQAA